MELITVAYKYLRRYHVLTTIVLFSIIMASLFEGVSFGMLIPLILGMTTEGVNLLQNLPFFGYLNSLFLSNNQQTFISFMFILLFLILLVKNIFVYLSNTLIVKLKLALVRDCRVKLMNNLLEYDIKYFDSIKTGNIVSNINAETQRMGDFISAVLQLTALTGKVIVFIILLFLISWKVSILVFALIASVLLPIELILKRVKHIGSHLTQALADYNYKLIELLGAVRLIKICATEDLEKKNFKSYADKIYETWFKSNKYSKLIIPLSEVFIFGLIALFFIISINLTKMDFKNIFAFIATYLLVLAKMLTQLNNLNGMRSDAVSNLAAFASYEALSEERGKKTILSGNRIIENFSDSIEFKNVSFSYINGRQVLDNVNIKIPKGKMAAVVGASGVGKSTMVNLIPRFYEVSLGEILIDGIRLQDLNLSKWRRKIGFVSQDIFIFNASVTSNIAYGYDKLSEEEVVCAAKAANAHDFIMKLPEKYDTILGERGIKLSGGQKQRISISRAIIHNPEILILDEATSSLDTETERLIREAVERLTRGRTVIAIAHRLSTILHSDNIIVLDEGRVVEMGHHWDLLKKNGLYKRLYNAQFSSIENTIKI